MPIPRGWHSRGHLPHADFAGLTQAVTFRLADALPALVLDRMRVDTAREAAGTNADECRSALLRERVQAWLDAGHGSCVLAQPAARDAVIDALRRHDAVRYRLDAFVVMPNHVHVLVGIAGTPLGRIVQAWKGTSARRINQTIGTVGNLWQREYHDRFIRDEEHGIAAVRYIAANPGRFDWPGLWIREGLRAHVQATAD